MIRTAGDSDFEFLKHMDKADGDGKVWILVIGSGGGLGMIQVKKNRFELWHL